MNEPTRRAWSRPELIVLVRSKPEEAVLETCKGGSFGGPTALVVACVKYGTICAGVAPS